MVKITIMKYLKQFSTMEEYNSFINGSGGTIYLPNISLINDETIAFNDSKWNQLVQNPTAKTFNLKNTGTGMTYSNSGYKCLSENWPVSSDGIKNKILFYIDYTVNSCNAISKTRLYEYQANTQNCLTSTNLATTGHRVAKYIHSMIKSVTYTPTWQQFMWGIGPGESLNITINYFQAFDLTALYGRGNEPSTPEEFFARYPEQQYPYKPY